MSKTLVVDDQAIKFQIWDTAGQEKYHSLAPMYYRGASAAIVVYDITRAVRIVRPYYRARSVHLPRSGRHWRVRCHVAGRWADSACVCVRVRACACRASHQTSFKTLQNWVQELQSLGPENIVIAIAGNKCDLEDKREVDRTEAQKYAEDIDAIFVETSAKTGDNVQEMFTDISAQQSPPPPLNSGLCADVYVRVLHACSAPGKKLPATTQAVNPNVIIHDQGAKKKACC